MVVAGYSADRGTVGAAGHFAARGEVVGLEVSICGLGHWVSSVLCGVLPRGTLWISKMVYSLIGSREKHWVGSTLLMLAAPSAQNVIMAHPDFLHHQAAVHPHSLPHTLSFAHAHPLIHSPSLQSCLPLCWNVALSFQ